jgi:SAM-dependent methyltransferase
MSLIPRPPADLSEEAVWQDVEFGSYAADLPLWEELAEACGEPVLEVGAGSGRVSLHLARMGIRVVSVDTDDGMVAELAARAGNECVPVRAAGADVTSPGFAELVAEAASPGTAGAETGLEFPLVIAPLQLLQLFGREGRSAALSSLASALSPGGRLAVALVDESTIATSEGSLPPPNPPDMREVDGWVYSSEPLWVQVSDEMLRMRRLRQRVSPQGDLVRSVHDDLLHRLPPETLEEEAGEAGLTPVSRREVEAGPNEAGSVVVILRKQ